MSDYKSAGDYATQTGKWRDAFGIANWLQYGEQVSAANDAIASLKQRDPQEYDRFMSDARAWGVREEKRAVQYREEHAPVTPRRSGGYHDNGEFIALSMSTSSGVLEVAMQDAFETGNVNFGYMISAYSNTRWRYDVTCVDYDATAISAATYLGRVTKSNPIECNVNSVYVARSSDGMSSYRKSGTCRIRCVYDGPSNVDATQSPQYDNGKERAPVHYRA
jgi:hypothetical protein